MRSKLISRYEQKRKLQEILRDSNVSMSIDRCLNTLPYQNEPYQQKPPLDPAIVRKESQLRIVNVFKCKSLWACPYCTQVKQKRVRDRLSNVVQKLNEKFGETGVHKYFNTLTLSHNYKDKLSESLNFITAAWRDTTSYTDVKKARKKAEYIGAQKWTEITFGRHGFHPHIHMISFSLLNYDVSIEQNRFINNVNTKTIRRSLSTAQDSQEISAERASELCGYAWSTLKKIKKINEVLSVRKKSFFLTERLNYIIRKSLRRDVKILEYLQSTYGKHAYDISTKLLSICDMKEDDCNENDEVDNDETIFLTVPYSVWIKANAELKDGRFVEQLMKKAHTFDKKATCDFLSKFATEKERNFLYNQLIV